MIRSLRGIVSNKTEQSLTVLLGGIGFLVRVLPEAAKNISLEEEVDLYTYLAVREDALDLYGFLAKEELVFFELLIGVSGIGPKSAISILSAAPPEALAQAILSGNTAYLTGTAGIGKKTAEKISLELRDKVASLAEKKGFLPDDNDALLALISLGYGRNEAREALRSIANDITETSARITQALKHLGKH